MLQKKVELKRGLTLRVIIIGIIIVSLLSVYGVANYCLGGRSNLLTFNTYRIIGNAGIGDLIVTQFAVVFIVMALISDIPTEDRRDYVQSRDHVFCLLIGVSI